MRDFLRRRKRKDRREPYDLEKVNEELHLRYFWLLVKELEFNQKLRVKAIHLSRKYSKQQPGVI